MMEEERLEFVIQGNPENLGNLENPESLANLESLESLENLMFLETRALENLEFDAPIAGHKSILSDYSFGKFHLILDKFLMY